MHPLLHIDKLSVSFRSGKELNPAVRDISVTVNRGEIVALVGESGSGKSVTALSILRLLPTPPAEYLSGKVLFSEDGNIQKDLLHVDKSTLQQTRGNRIAMIFQEPMTSLNPVLTCGDQLLEAIRQHRRISYTAAREKAVEWFTKVQLPDPGGLLRRYPHQLSGGQKQRVMIAIAMCCEPALLICDEPTTALDVTVQKTILGLIRDLQKQTGMGVIFITHDLGVVADIADRAIVMYQGQIVEQNGVKALFSNPTHSYTKALLACRPVNHKRGERLPVVADFMNPGERSTVKEPAVGKIIPTTNEALVSVKELSVWFPAKKKLFGKVTTYTRAVDNVSFEVYKGETLGLVGESGCGKTTLGRTLLRLIEPTSGKIIYQGEDMAHMTRKQLSSLRKDIQIVFQDPYSSLNPRLTIGNAIAEPLMVHDETSNAKQRKDQVISLLEKVNLRGEHYNRYPHEFSGGQRQRIVIARALALGPSFVVCDESVSALDVSVQAQVLNLLNDLKRDMGFTMIFISHDLSVVRYISDRIMVMNNGRIEEIGSSEEVYNHPRSNYTRQLVAAVPGKAISQYA